MSEHVVIRTPNGDTTDAVVLGRLGRARKFIWNGKEWDFADIDGEVVVLQDGEDIPGLVSQEEIL